MHFSELGLSSVILRALEQEGYSSPTPIQRQTIPAGLAGRDVLGCAQTGTGKTAAFALPILQRLAAAPVDKTRRGPRRARALILSPTRELAAQIAESFATYGSGLHLEHAVVFGGVSQFHQERALRRGVDIIVATPGRLIDLMDQRIADLSGVEIFVLDEADRMLDMGFINPIRKIAAAVPAGGRQTLLFSATMPREIVHLAHSLLRDPVKVSVNPESAGAPKIEQGVFMVSRHSKLALLEHLLGAEDRGLGAGAEKTDGAKRDAESAGRGRAASSVARALVFTRTKRGAERVGKQLARAGISSDTIHGNKSQPQRKRALARFATGQARVLVATDVAARGLDVDQISHVFNFDLPDEPEAYVHRIGRTGRAGATGIALSFCDGEERGLLRDIERLLGKPIAVRATPAVTPRPAAAAFRPEPAREAGYQPPRGPRPHRHSGRGPEPRAASGHAGPARRPARSAAKPSWGRSARGWRKASR